MQSQMQLLRLGEHNLTDYLALPEIEVDLDAEEKCSRLEQVSGIERIAFAEELFPRIDPSFLAIPHPNGYNGRFICYNITDWGIIIDETPVPFKLSLPRFAIYSPNSHYCRLNVEIKPRGLDVEVDEQELPEPMIKALKESLKVEPKKAKYSPFDQNHFQFTSTFKGIIPEKVKRTIDYARKVFDNQIYIIAEAENWDGKVVPIEDPLVVGSINDKIYLIDQFNCTSLEDYFRREFVEPRDTKTN